MLLLALRGRTPDAVHHQVSFPSDYDAEFDSLFGGRRHPARPVPDPAISICNPQDPLMRPRGHEAWSVLVNAPPHGRGSGTTVDWDAPGFAEQYADAVLASLRQRGVDLADRILWRRIITPADLERDTLSPGGSIYGAASHGRASALRRPANRSAVPGLFLVGGTSHPGGGLPLVGMSAEIVSDLIGRAWACVLGRPRQCAGSSPTHPASLPRSESARRRRVVARRTSSVATTRSWSPTRSRVCRSGTRPSPSRTTRDTTAPRGRLRSLMYRPDSREPAGISKPSRAAVIRSSGAASTSSSLGETPLATPSRRAAQGSTGACARVRMTTRISVASNTVADPATPAPSGIAAKTMGTAPRNPAIAVKATHGPGNRNGNSVSAAKRPAQHDERDTRHQRHPERRHRPAGLGQQPQHHEQADLRGPGQALGEADHGAAVRQPLGVAHQDAGDVGGQEAGRVQDIRQAVGADQQRHHRDRVEADGGQRQPRDEPASREADRQADRQPADQLQQDDQRDLPAARSCMRRSRRTGRPPARRRGHR